MLPPPPGPGARAFASRASRPGSRPTRFRCATARTRISARVFARARVPRGLAGFRQLQGKELSYNNLTDADGAWRLVHDLPSPGVAIVKHGGPCGAGLGGGGRRLRARSRLRPGLGVRRRHRLLAAVDGRPPRGSPSCLPRWWWLPGSATGHARCSPPRENLRVLLPPPPVGRQPRLRAVDGGLLVQTPDEGWDEEWRAVTERAPTEDESAAMRLAWRVAKHAPSNAVVVASADATVAIGAGQPSRVDSCRIAVEKARAAGLPLPARRPAATRSFLSRTASKPSLAAAA